MIYKVTFRSLLTLGAIGTLILLGSTYLLEYGFHFSPCPLCLLQRYALWIVTGLFWIGVLHNPNNVGRIFYCISIIIFSGLGLAIAGRHLWIQHFPSATIASCSAGLEKMLAFNPWFDVLKTVLSAPQSCLQPDALILGLSLPFWSLLSFIGIAVFTIALLDLQIKRRI